MIKINLLPVRQLKKRAKARNQLIGLFVGLLCLFSVAGLVTYYQLGKVTVLENQISALNKEKQRYAPIIAQIKKMEQQKKELERRIDVIKKLKTDSSLTVRVMDEVANIIDTDRMWLLSLNQQGGSLQLSGIALDNQTVAQFMDNLKVSPIVRDVDLTDSSLKNIAGRDLKSFSMTVSVAQPNPKEVATAK